MAAPAQTEAPPSPRIAWPRLLAAGLLVALVALAAFQPAVHNTPAVDDISQLHDWPPPDSPRGWAEAALQPWWPAHLHKHDWRPLARISILAQKAALGAAAPVEVWPYYAFNIGAHAAVCLLLLLAAVRLGVDRRAALIGALLFAAHPLHAEAVAQAVGRTELLAAALMLLGLALWTRWGPWSLHAFWQQPLVYALALGAKEHAALYPLFLLLAAAGGRVGQIPGQSGLRRWLATRQLGRLCGMMAGLAVVLAAWLGLKFYVTGGLGVAAASVPATENPLAHMAFAGRLPASLGGLGYAAAHLFWPTHLSPDYSAVSLPWGAGWDWDDAIAGAALMALLSVYAMFNAIRGGRGWALVLGGLAAWALTSSLPFPIGAAPTPRLWYWPSAAACIGVGWLVVSVADRLPSRARGRVLIGATTVAVALLLAVTWKNAPDWRSQRALAEATVRVFPDNLRAQTNLAREDYFDKEFESGLAHARRATRIEPSDPLPWGWVGLNAMFLPGKAHLDEAEAAFERSLALNPDLPETRHNLENLRRMRASTGQ